MKHTIIPKGSMVDVQREGGRPWMDRTIIKHGNEEHNGQSYKIHTTKICLIVMRNMRHILQTPISSEQYLQDQIAKNNEKS